MDITPLTRNPSGDFAGEVAGIDLTRPLTPGQVAAIDAGMDRYAVLVFHDQHFTTTRSSPSAATSANWKCPPAAEMSKPEERRLKLEMADISNLDRDSKVLRRATIACG